MHFVLVAPNFQITRHLSPFAQQPVMPWLRTFPELVSGNGCLVRTAIAKSHLSLCRAASYSTLPFVCVLVSQAVKKFTRSFPYWGSAVGIVWGTTALGDYLDDEQDRAHRF